MPPTTGPSPSEPSSPTPSPLRSLLTLPASSHGRQPTFERASAILDRVRAAVGKRTETPELPFGILPLDELTHGLWRGKLTVVAGRSSQGKTSLALQTAWNLADAGKTVVFITLEDDREEVIERLLCQVGRVDNQALRRGELPPEDPILRQAFDKVKILVLDNFGYTNAEIEYVVKALEPKPDVVVVDYAQMVDDENAESEYRAISVFIRALKIFAEANEIAVLLCSQINRQGAMEGRPSLHHLARCGRLEEVANTVLLLYWPYGTKDSSFDGAMAANTCPPDYFELEVAKNKTGPKGTVRLQFTGKHYLFAPWSPPQEATHGTDLDL